MAPPPGTGGAPALAVGRRQCNFDDEDGDDDWILEQSDNFTCDPDRDGPDQDEQRDDTLQDIIDSRVRQSSRRSFFDDEDGDDDMRHEPDDLPAFAGIVDRRGLPEFSKATKFTGSWLGMVFKLGSSGLGYYRDDRMHHLNLMELISAGADAAPVVLNLDEVIPAKTTAKDRREAEPDTCPRRKEPAPAPLAQERRRSWPGHRMAQRRLPCCQLYLPRHPRPLGLSIRSMAAAGIRRLSTSRSVGGRLRGDTRSQDSRGKHHGHGAGSEEQRLEYGYQPLYSHCS